jgi:hypothetical protein
VPALGATASGVPASDYVVGPGDQLSVIVMELQDDASFSQQAFTVNISGDVSLPYAGRVRAVGLTTHDIERESHREPGEDHQGSAGCGECRRVSQSAGIGALGQSTQAASTRYKDRSGCSQALSLAGGFTDDVGNSITITRDHPLGPNTAAQCA